MKTPKFLGDTIKRIEMVLSKNRSSFSTDDVILLEKCILFYNKMRKAKSDQDKKEFLTISISYYMKFMLKNELLKKYSELFENLGKITE